MSAPVEGAYRFFFFARAASQRSEQALMQKSWPLPWLIEHFLMQ